MGQRINQQSIQILGVPSSPHAVINSLALQFLTRVINPAHAVSGYLRDALINHVFRSATYAKPLGLWIASYTLPPSDTDPGTEVTGGGYSRTRYDPGEANWNPPTAGDGTTSNGLDLALASPTDSWGLVTAYGILDAASGGNLLAYSTLDTPQSVDVGSVPAFLTGDLTVSLDTGALSDYLEGALIDHVFRVGTFAKLASVYAGLYTVAPGDSGGGTEISAGGYARASILVGDSYWAAPVSGNGMTSNLVPIQFPAPSANWGTPVAVGLFDAATSGNLLWHGALSSTIAIRNGDGGPAFPIGALTVALT